MIDFTSRGPRVTSLSVLCQPGGRERREQHATRGVQVLDGEYSWQYFPDRDLVLKRPASAEGGEMLRPEQLQRAIRSYAIQVVPSGSDRRAAQPRPRVRARVAGSRPRRVVWVDAETALVLRTEVYGTNNRLAWLSVFEELEYRPSFDAAAFMRPGPPDVTVVEAAPSRASSPPRPSGWPASRWPCRPTSRKVSSASASGPAASATTARSRWSSATA